jgi:hypothetical protein
MLLEGKLQKLLSSGRATQGGGSRKMASAESQKPTCPVCKQADKVKTVQAAYDSGVARCAPPDMPTRNVSMFKLMIVGIFIVGICSFLIIVLIGGMEANMDIAYATILVSITLVCIVTALVLSFIAFQRVVRGDIETTVRYPAWDRAMEQWRILYYCSRDDAVFNPQNGKVVSDGQLKALRSIDEAEAAQKSALATQH